MIKMFNSIDKKVCRLLHLPVIKIAIKLNISRMYVYKIIKKLIAKKMVIKKENPLVKHGFVYEERLISNSVTQIKFKCNKTYIKNYFKTHYRYITDILKYINIKHKYTEYILIYVFMKCKGSNVQKKRKRLILDMNLTYSKIESIKFKIKLYPVLRRFAIKFKKEGYTIPDELINLLKDIKKKVKEKGLERKLKPKTFRKGYNKIKKEVRDSTRQELIDVYNEYFYKRYKRNSDINRNAKTGKMLNNLIQSHKDELELIKLSFKSFIEDWDYIKEDYKLLDRHPNFVTYIKIKNDYLNEIKEEKDSDDEKWF